MKSASRAEKNADATPASNATTQDAEARRIETLMPDHGKIIGILRVSVRSVVKMLLCGVTMASVAIIQISVLHVQT
jgi:hypothetical protein